MAKRSKAAGAVLDTLRALSVAKRVEGRAWSRYRMAVEERRIALRFLRRAMRVAAGLHQGRAGLPNGVGDRQRWALWRVVVAASHKSGTFDGTRKGGK